MVFGKNEFSGYRGLVIPMLTSCGCPLRCSFCSNWILGAFKVFLRSPENVVEEMRALKEKYGISAFHFCDDSFGILRKHVLEVCERINQSKLDPIWRCTISANATCKREVTEMMGVAGCRMAFIGVESGDEGALASINKPFSLDQVRRSVANLRAANIACTSSFIIGLPADTPQSISQTMAFAAEIGADRLSLHIAEPLPGTTMWRQALEDGGMDVPPDIFSPPGGYIRYSPLGLRSWNLEVISRHFSLYWAVKNRQFRIGVGKHMFRRGRILLYLAYHLFYVILGLKPGLPIWAHRSRKTGAA